MASEITYDPSLNLAAGYVVVQPAPADEASGGPPLRPQDGKTLLFLLFTLLYTRPGRDLMRNNKPANGQLTDAQRQTLLKAFSDCGVTSPDLQNALIDAHIAADTWATSFKNDQANDSARVAPEKVYLQKMAFITWCLWEDAKGHEFSMGW